MTTIVSVMYPTTEGARFDMDYYLSKHMPLVQEKLAPLGLRHWEVLRGSGAPGGGPAAYQVVASLTFDTPRQFEDGMGRHGKQIVGDIPNFTDIRPVMQISEVVGEMA